MSVTVHPVLATTAEPRRRCRTCRYEYVGADAIAVDLRTVQELLGHKDPTMTARYGQLRWPS